MNNVESIEVARTSAKGQRLRGSRGQGAFDARCCRYLGTINHN